MRSVRPCQLGLARNGKWEPGPPTHHHICFGISGDQGGGRGGRYMTPDPNSALCSQESQTRVPPGPVTMAAPVSTTSANTSVTVPQASPGGTVR